MKNPGPKGRGASRPAAAIGSKNNSTAPLVWASVIVAVAFGIYYLSGASANKARDAPSLGNRHIRVGTSPAVSYNTDPPTSGTPLSDHRPLGRAPKAHRQGLPGA